MTQDDLMSRVSKRGTPAFLSGFRVNEKRGEPEGVPERLVVGCLFLEEWGSFWEVQSFDEFTRLGSGWLRPRPL